VLLTNQGAPAHVKKLLVCDWKHTVAYAAFSDANPLPRLEPRWRRPAQKSSAKRDFSGHLRSPALHALHLCHAPWCGGQNRRPSAIETRKSGSGTEFGLVVAKAALCTNIHSRRPRCLPSFHLWSVYLEVSRMVTHRKRSLHRISTTTRKSVNSTFRPHRLPH